MQQPFKNNTIKQHTGYYVTNKSDNKNKDHISKIVEKNELLHNWIKPI